MDFILRNAVLAADPSRRLDIGVVGGRIAAVEPALPENGETIDAGGRLVLPGFVETHIHLDKSCLFDRCTADGNLAEAIAEVAGLKRAFTEDDVAERATKTLRKAIGNGTTVMRTHVEVDPGVGLRGFRGVQAAIADHRDQIDVEICVFPQEGLLNNPGTDELMVEALDSGAAVVGAAPYTDSSPHGQIDRVFELARAYDVPIDMHLDFGADPANLDLDHVCRRTDEYGWGGRVAIGHVTKLSYLAPERLDAVARRLADAGVAVTVLPSTDLFLMGRDRDHAQTRGVTPAHRLLAHGVNCSLSTNNVLNPFTPFGDCSLIRAANLYCNICQIGSRPGMFSCVEMVTERSAKLINRDDYGIAPGRPADLVVVDAADPATAVAELAPALMGFKGGRRTFTRRPVELHF